MFCSTTPYHLTEFSTHTHDLDNKPLSQNYDYINSILRFGQYQEQLLAVAHQQEEVSAFRLLRLARRSLQSHCDKLVDRNTLIDGALLGQCTHCSPVSVSATNSRVI
jgi:hypothetical protein